MIDNVADDLTIIIYDERHWYTIGKGEYCGHEVSYLWRICQIIESAARQKAFRHKTTPDVHQWHQGPRNRIRPDEHNKEHHLTT